MIPLTISTVFLRFFAPPSEMLVTDCASLIFRFSFPPSSPSDRAMGASRVPSSIFTFPADGDTPLDDPATDERAGSGRVAVDSAAETDADGARMLIFLDLGFLVEGLITG